MKNRVIVITVTFLCLALSSAWAQFYRFTDNEGNVYVQSSIPPEFVAGGYEIVDSRGIVITRVAPQLSQEEIAKRQANQLSTQMQQARDQELLKLYRSPADVDRAMNTWLSRMDMEIRVKRNRIRVKEAEYAQYQEQAANLERAGQEVGQDILLKMESVQLEIDQFLLEIEEVELRQQDSREEFLLDRQRMTELWKIRTGKEWVDEPDDAAEENTDN